MRHLRTPKRRRLERDLFELVADVRMGSTAAAEFPERLEWILAIHLGRDAAAADYARERGLALELLEASSGQQTQPIVGIDREVVAPLSPAVNDDPIPSSA